MTDRVVVVGAGIIGLSTAYYLRERGYPVTVVARGPRDEHGCSWGNAGMIVPSHFVPLAAPGMVQLGLRMLFRPGGPFAIRLAPDLSLLRWCWRFSRSCTREHVERSAPLLRDLNLASRELFLAWSRETGADFQLTTRGLVMLCKHPDTLREEAHLADHAHQLGVPAEVMAPQALAALDPGIRMDVAGGVYFPQDAHLSSTRLMHWLIGTLEQRGVEFCCNSPVTGWEAAGSRITAVHTPQQTITGAEFVLAPGAWLPALARPLGLSLPLQPGKGYSLTVPQPPALPQLCSILVEARVAVTPMGADLRFAGTMEIGQASSRINQGRVNGVLRSIPDYFPQYRDVSLADRPVWSGLRPCSPDGLPYLGRPRRWSNLCIAGGHAMMGLSLGPISGQLTAALVAGDRPSLDLAPLSPDRFA